MNTTVPQLTNSKEDMIWLLMLREVILKNEVIGYVYLLLHYYSFLFMHILIINKAKKKRKDFLSIL